jgi:hypothetical protein
MPTGVPNATTTTATPFHHQSEASAASRNHAGRARRSDSVLQYSRVEIHPSARRTASTISTSGTPSTHSLAIEDIDEDPDRWLVIGPDRAGNLHELVVLVDHRGEIVIHAMPLRPKYRKLLEQ